MEEPANRAACVGEQGREGEGGGGGGGALTLLLCGMTIRHSLAAENSLQSALKFIVLGI